MKQNQQQIVRVSGQGDSKQRAFANALSQVQKQVLKNSSNMMLRIEPLNIQIVSAIKNITTERFLFIFLPRKKAIYDITLDVAVDVCFVDLSHIEFTSQ